MSRIKRFLPALGLGWVILYFVYHTLTGAQGLNSKKIYQQQEAVLSQRLVGLQTCRAGIEKRIQLLGDQNLDLDYLEERAHAVLYLANSKDIVLTVDTVKQVPQTTETCAQS